MPGALGELSLQPAATAQPDLSGRPVRQLSWRAPAAVRRSMDHQGAVLAPELGVLPPGATRSDGLADPVLQC